MISFSKFRNELREQRDILDSFYAEDCYVQITSDNQIVVDGEYIGDCTNLEEARSYVIKYIANKKIVENIDSVIPEEKLVKLIQRYHNIDKVTSNLVESYIELASSNLFTLDPVITEMKTVDIVGKLVYTLEDGSKVAINESTFERLKNLLDDKYQIVEYMRKSKENFVHVVKELKE